MAGKINKGERRYRRDRSTPYNDRDYFGFLERESPVNCRIKKLEPVNREKSERILKKSESPSNVPKEQQAISMKSKGNVSTLLYFSKEKSRICLPAIKYTSEAGLL